MYEYVSAAVVRLDKPKTLGGIEPFNCTCSHLRVPLFETTTYRRWDKGSSRSVTDIWYNGVQCSNLSKPIFLASVTPEKSGEFPGHWANVNGNIDIVDDADGKLPLRNS